jgi:hypothetical protein
MGGHNPEVIWAKSWRAHPGPAVKEPRRREMDEPQTDSERLPDEPQIEADGRSEQEQTTGITGKIDQAASRARDAVTGAKEAVVGTVTAQGEHAIEKVKEGARTVEGTAKDYIYIVAVACLALGFVLGLLVHTGGSKSRSSHHMDWRPWS